jgi:hypothetical protein
MNISAMKQALEAMERIKSYGNIFMYRKTERNPYDQAVEAITALRQAIEQAEKQEPVIGTKTWFEDGKVVTQHLHPSDIYASDISAERVDETAKDRHEWVGLDHEQMRNTPLQFNRGALWAERYLKEKNNA